MTAPQFASVPQEMIASMCEWLTPLLNASSTATKQADVQHIDRPIAPPILAMDLPSADSALRAGITERPVFLTSEVVLFGIVSEPPRGEMPHRAVILVNAGADYHIGATGMYVGFARAGSARIRRLALGSRGTGDSATRRGGRQRSVSAAASTILSCGRVGAHPIWSSRSGTWRRVFRCLSRLARRGCSGSGYSDIDD